MFITAKRVSDYIQVEPFICFMNTGRISLGRIMIESKEVNSLKDRNKDVVVRHRYVDLYQTTIENTQVNLCSISNKFRGFSTFWVRNSDRQLLLGVP